MVVDSKCPIVLICAGGTGGHIIPGLSIAQELIKHGCKLHWLGTKYGLEKELVPKAGIKINYIKITGLRGKGWKTWLVAPYRLFLSLYQALKIISKVNPDLVIGMGGFVAGPAGLAAKILGKKLIIHEQNSIPGATNKILSMVADRTLCGFPDSFAVNEKNKAKKNLKAKDFSKANKICYTGNPVRPDLATISDYQASYVSRPDNKLKVLILGGSRGARILNKSLPIVAKQCKQVQLEIWHQAGKLQLEQTENAYQQAGVTAKVEAFVEDVKAAYEWADVIICRAGALTISELAVAGRASILVPFRFAVDNHQYYNAKFLADNGAAIIINEDLFTPEKVIEVLDSLVTHRKQLAKMATAARKQAVPAAVDNVVGHCLSFL